MISESARKDAALRLDQLQKTLVYIRASINDRVISAMDSNDRVVWEIQFTSEPELKIAASQAMQKIPLYDFPAKS